MRCTGKFKHFLSEIHGVSDEQSISVAVRYVQSTVRPLSENWFYDNISMSRLHCVFRKQYGALLSPNIPNLNGYWSVFLPFPPLLTLCFAARLGIRVAR